MMESSEIKKVAEIIANELIKSTQDVNLDEQVKKLLSSILFNRLAWRNNESLETLDISSAIQFTYDWVHDPRKIRTISHLLDLSDNQNQLRDSIILGLIQHLQPFCKEPGVILKCQCGCEFSRVISYYRCHYDQITFYQVKCYQCEAITELKDYQIEKTYLDSQEYGMGQVNAAYQLSQLKNQINVLIGDPKGAFMGKNIIK